MDNIVEFFKSIKEIWIILTLIGSGISGALFSFHKHRKNRILKKEGIKDRAEKGKELFNQKIKEQEAIVEENSVIMYSKIEKFYNKKLNIETNSTKYFFLKIFLSELKKFTDELMGIIIENNKLIKKTNTDWRLYKERKHNWIFEKTTERAEQLYSSDIMGMNYNNILELTATETYRIYNKYIDIIFEDIKKITEEIEPQIKNNKESLDKMIYK